MPKSVGADEMLRQARPITGQHPHEVIRHDARSIAHIAGETGDDGTNDLLVSSVVRTNELQAWFIAEHVVDVPVVGASDPQGE